MPQLTCCAAIALSTHVSKLRVPQLTIRGLAWIALRFSKLRVPQLTSKKSYLAQH
ncbi:hypothetical protein GLIP_0350 [Aliiglaciecola lipolytica E3]|uniref:Uncharacterized protein n=1 Tax=Aliiglaciecola lipolytica E3 TaxID=1127673 RepID=K6Y401_9ALTE|nr:hypothetical protein GLIP_0350 [Aliiglaciecola lipolytica E3]